MITTVGKYISNNLSREVRESKYFSILADEAADISNKEHLSVVIRFVDSEKNIPEEFVGFYLCEGGTAGVAINELILQASADLGLSMDDCRGQCYDGAGNMAGRLSGASSLIRQAHEKAIYVHCINLCVADTCSLALVSTMMNVVTALSDFFNNSPKRQQCLIAKIRELLPNSNHRVLIDVCRTRWISRIDGMDRIVERLPAIISLLEDVSLNSDIQVDENTTIGNWNIKSRNDAQNLINAATFPFIVSVVIVRHILDLTRPLTVKLQRKEMDLLKAKDEIASLKSDLSQMQADIDARHHHLYTEAVNLERRSGSVEPSVPRIVQRQVYRPNAPAPTPEDYYKINLTRVFLDHSMDEH
ncbi:52 kDa repressor of the inhibitor of the protein kinase-like [Montipora foliosa]|uniref:52 kDa repressor of the inhibitor of the protein kinase-like n=1 Tax=Montipora foliosa TaxID=591990 RepID=UPI0035F11DCD